jgi:hypothetical protein
VFLIAVKSKYDRLLIVILPRGAGAELTDARGGGGAGGGVQSPPQESAAVPAHQAAQVSTSTF